MSLNWDDEDVVDLLDCYRNGEIKTLEGLRLELHDITGVFVTTKTLSVRLRGLRTHNSGGRPRMQQLTANDSIQRRTDTSRISMMDWENADVKRALDDYRMKKIATLQDLRIILQDLTGVSVSAMTLSRRVRGLMFRNCIGRPRKQALFTSYSYYQQGRTISTPAPPLPEEEKDEEEESASSSLQQLNYSPSPSPPPTLRPKYFPTAIDLTPRTEIKEYISVANLTTPESLSKRLSKNILTVPVGEGLVRQFCLTKQNEDGTIKYYRCSKCSSLHRKWNTDILPKVHVRNGLIDVDELHQPHHPDCHPVNEMKALATEIDRRCRKEVRAGRFAPKEIYNMGLEEVHKLAEAVEGPHNSHTLLAL